ncbi:MAG: metal-dependent hydrolase [Planctomycetota bacterium]
MDNLAHTLLATALAKTPLGRRSPLSTAALLIGANLPDADAISGFWGIEAYLTHHRGLSHAILGIAIEFVLLGAALAWVELRFFSKFINTSEPRRGPWLAAAIGLISHPLLDSLNAYGVRPFIPFDDHCYYGDMLFIVDPWAWFLFGSTTALAGARTVLGSIALLLIAISTTLVMFISDRAPSEMCIIWPVMVVLISALRFTGFGANRAVPIVIFSLILFISYCVGMRVLGNMALEKTRADVQYQLPHGESIINDSRSPRPADPRKWIVTIETERFVIQRDMTLGSASNIQFRIAKNHDLPEVAAVMNTDSAQAWKKFARHPIAVVSHKNGSSYVELTDARFGLDPTRNWSTIRIRIAETPVR